LARSRRPKKSRSSSKGTASEPKTTGAEIENTTSGLLPKTTILIAVAIVAVTVFAGVLPFNSSAAATEHPPLASPTLLRKRRSSAARLAPAATRPRLGFGKVLNIN